MGLDFNDPANWKYKQGDGYEGSEYAPSACTPVFINLCLSKNSDTITIITLSKAGETQIVSLDIAITANNTGSAQLQVGTGKKLTINGRTNILSSQTETAPANFFMVPIGGTIEYVGAVTTRSDHSLGRGVNPFWNNTYNNSGSKLGTIIIRDNVSISNFVPSATNGMPGIVIFDGLVQTFTNNTDTLKVIRKIYH